MRSNDFLKLGYAFEGWYAYRKSDKKWYCINTKTGKKMWRKAGKINGDFKKYLFNNKVKVRNLSSKNNDVITMYAQWKQKVYTKKGSNTITFTVYLNDQGPTVFTMYYSYLEKYSIKNDVVEYFYRSLYSYAKCGRPYATGYHIDCSGIRHTTGDKTTNFDMITKKSSLFPGDNVFSYDKENRTAVKYKKDNDYLGSFSLSINTSNISLKSKRIEYSLNFRGGNLTN